MHLAERTTVLIVGAGPTGLAAAIALHQQGIHDIVVVDALLQGQNSSRAIAIHAATLEALDTIGCVEGLVRRGIKAKGLMFNTEHESIVSADMTILKDQTPFNYVLLLQQTVTESILHQRLESLGVQVVRPCRVTGLRASDSQLGGLDITMESGQVINAQYVIGADGIKSVVRDLAGITYSDPGDVPVGDQVVSFVFADVVLDHEDPFLPRDFLSSNVCLGGLFFTLPLPSDTPGENVHRVAFNVSASSGTPPSHPSTEYIQDLIDKQGPRHLCSDPSVNDRPIRIQRTIWSSRYKTSSAVADTFVARLPGLHGSVAGSVVLIGDAAHSHSPLGGHYIFLF